MMVDPENWESIKTEWWQRWWRADYSWHGLADKTLGADDIPWEESQGLFGETSLQAYWRRDFATGQQRTDEELESIGELIRAPDKTLWHLAHVPLKWRNEEPGKSQWDNQKKIQLATILRQKLSNTDVSYIDANDSRNSRDGRAQFSGMVFPWNFSFKNPHLITSHQALVRMVCFRSWIEQISAVELDFLEDLDFSESFFVKSVNFSKCKIQGNMIFNSTKFGGRASFFETQFEKNVMLPGALFSGAVNFSKARIQRDANFFDADLRGSSSFDGIHFFGQARFEKAKFWLNASFRHAHFHAYANFFHTKFSAENTFYRARFDQRTNFDYSSFESVARFTSSSFGGRSSFRGALFHSGALFEEIQKWGEKPSDWGRAFFDAKASRLLSFEHSTVPPFGAFQGLRLESGAFLSFDDPGITTMKAVFKEQLSEIQKKPRETASNQKHDVGNQFHRLSADLVGGCRFLKNYFESISDRELAQRFFRFELQARMTFGEIGGMERWVFGGYRVFSDYGASIGRPLLWLGFAFISFAFFYWALAAFWLAPEVTFDRKVLIGSFDFSLRQTFPFVITDLKADNAGFNMRKILLGDGDHWQNLLVRSVTVLQTTFSLAMIFLSGLAIRRRFKMD